jgi:hypothetical protein
MWKWLWAHWRGLSGNATKEGLFFEKKNQKTFAPALLSPDASLLRLARNQMGKSFLVLFFKKEHFLCCGGHGRAAAAV